MPTCRLCIHPDAEDLADAILAGQSARALAARYDVPKSTMHNHTKHVARRITGQPAGHHTGQAVPDLRAVQTLLHEAYTQLEAQRTPAALALTLHAVTQLVERLLATAPPVSG